MRPEKIWGKYRIMFRGSRSRARIVPFVVAGALVSAVPGALPKAAQADAAAPRAASPRFVGALVSHAENATTSWGRDGGLTVPLPNGKDFWLFGDTPRYTYQGGRWRLTAFLYGSSAGMISYTTGRKPNSAFYEVNVRRKLSASNQPAEFLPRPALYMPDGSGRACNKKNGGASAGASRWPTGATLMPDKTNVLISYVGVCVISATNFTVESWGFAMYDWKTNRFSVGPSDVWKPQRSGAALSTTLNRGSPIIVNKKVTFFSLDGAGRGLTTTVPANTTALRKKSGYVAKAIPGLPPTLILAVRQPSSTQRHLTMYQLSGPKRGQYRLLSSASPTGSWKTIGSGTLPRCGTAPAACMSVSLHPELSTSNQMLVSYYLPGYGPGVATKHPYPHPPLGHVVLAYLPG